MSKGLGITLAVVGVLLLAVFMVFGSYVTARNQMVAKDQVVKASVVEVDVQLERRADLIPNLVETVKGFTKEESTVFGDIANARAGMLNAQGPGRPRSRPTTSSTAPSAGCCCSPRTIRNCAPATSSCACRTSWPEPRTASRSRAMRYNDALQDYNTFILQFPNNIWAGIAGFHQNNAYFEASPAAQTVPTVKF